MKNTLGLIFTYKTEEGLNQLTQVRSISSIPFGGRYRIVDFLLSNMVNSGITKIGLITRDNYSSLMDHVGSGGEWDLARKRDGLYFIPPFSNGGSGSSSYRGRMEALASAMHFIMNSHEEYVLLADADSIFNGTFDEMMAYHKEKDADITIMYKKGNFKNESFSSFCFLDMNEDGRVTDLTIDPETDRENLCTGTVLIKRTLLLTLIRDCASHNRTSMRKDVLQPHLNDLKIYGYQYKGYIKMLTTVASFFECNMDLLNPEVQDELFNSENPIATKIRDKVPTIYRGTPKVVNSLIADGCIIEGQVENSIIFRGVHIRKGTKISNCIIMQDSEIQEGTELNYVVADKDVVIRQNSKLFGLPQYPTVLPKGSVV